MKEIIKKVIIGILAVVLVIGVAAFVLKGNDSPDVQDSTTGTVAGSTAEGEDKAGTAKPDNGVNADATTDNSGSQGGSNTSQSSSGGTDVQNPSGGNDVQVPSGTQGNNPTQNGQQPSSNGGSDVQQPSSSGVQPSQGHTGTSSQPGTSAPSNPLQTNKIDAYQEIFRSGRFIMKVNDPDLGPVTMAMGGNKMFVEASMEGITLKMLYDGDKPSEDNPQLGSWYIIIDKIKKYSPMPADMVGDMNVEELTKDFANGDSNTVYTKSTEVLNGEELYCESWVDANGNITKYYFRGDVLIRSDSVSPSGEVSTTEFQEINGNVDDSVFAIPEGYAKLDISWLFKMIG